MTAILIGGLIVGACYALFGSGLMLVYRQSGVLNFAHGAVSTLGAYGAYAAYARGAPWWVGLLAGMLVGALLELALDVFVVRRLRGHSDWAGAVATVGAGILLIGAATLIWGARAVSLRAALSSRMRVALGSAQIPVNDVIVGGLALLVCVGLWLAITRTRFGLALQASSAGPVTARLLGIRTSRVEAATWALSGALAGLAGVLISPTYGLSPTFMTTFSIGAFTAVVVGGLESIFGVLVGGMGFGIAGAFVDRYTGGLYTYTFSLLILVAFLTLAPYGLFGQKLGRVLEPRLAPSRGRVSRARLALGRLFARASSRSGSASTPRSPGARTRQSTVAGLILGACVLLALLVVVLRGPAPLVLDLLLTAGMFPAVLGQKVISGDCGQVSIGTSGFMVVGAYATVVLAMRSHLPFALVLLLGLAASALSGALLAVATRRLGGVYFALVTLGFALAMPELAGDWSGVTGGYVGINTPVFALGGLRLASPRSLGVAALALAAASALGVALVLRGRWGRMWRAVRDSEHAAASVGIGVWRAKILASALGAALAALGGVLSAVSVAYLSPSSFTFWTSLYLLIAMVVGGTRSVLGVAIGAAVIVLLPIALSTLPHLPDLVFGAAVVLVLLFAPGGLGTVGQVGRLG